MTEPTDELVKSLLNLTDWLATRRPAAAEVTRRAANMLDHPEFRTTDTRAGSGVAVRAAALDALRQFPETEETIFPVVASATHAALGADTRADDVVGELRAENERLRDWLAKTQMRAHKWMEAHDKLAAGKPYDLPKPSDLPDLVGELREALERIAAWQASPAASGTLAYKIWSELTGIARAALSRAALDEEETSNDES